MAISDNEKKVLARASRILEREVKALDSILSSPQLVRDYLKYKLAANEHEEFHIVVMNNRHAVIEMIKLTEGGIDSAAVDIREMVKRVLAINGAAIILVSHSHPSLINAEPSQTDIDLTLKIQKTMNMVGLRLLDHLIVAGESTVSLAERGLM